MSYFSSEKKTRGVKIVSHVNKTKFSINMDYILLKLRCKIVFVNRTITSCHETRLHWKNHYLRTYYTVIIDWVQGQQQLCLTRERICCPKPATNSYSIFTLKWSKFLCLSIFLKIWTSIFPMKNSSLMHCDDASLISAKFNHRLSSYCRNTFFLRII